MNACIGWSGPCEIHGQFHGCVHPEGHGGPGKGHRCQCGATPGPEALRDGFGAMASLSGANQYRGAA